jgi:hypothetical protein
VRNCLSCVLGIPLLLWCSSVQAVPIFHDSFTRTGELVGTAPDTGGGAYVYGSGSLPGITQVKEGTGGNAHLVITSNHSGSFNFFEIQSTPIGLNYAYSPTLYMTATFSSSDLSSQYTSHLGVEVGVNVRKNGTGEDLVREQQIGLGQSGWYGDLAADPHTVAWGNGMSSSKFALSGYTLGDTVTLAMKIEEQFISSYTFKAYAAVVPLSGDEPAWTQIAGEAGKEYAYSVDYIGLTVGGTDGGVSNPQTHSGYIDEIRIGKTWSDVAPIPEPTIVWLLGPALLGLLDRRRKTFGKP